jgi:3-oxoacyl-[acyl-carrier-protein] synthase-3
VRATILGVGEWRPATRRVNADWPAEVVEGWRRRAAAAQAEMAKQAAASNIDGALLTHRPDLDLADQLTQEGYARDASDPFLFTKERRVADPGTTAVDAGTFAGRAALEDAGVDPADVHLVVLWDAVPDRPGSPAAPKLAEQLGATSAHAFDIQQACSSVVSSLELGAGLIESGRARYVLAVQTHIGLRLTGFENPVSANVGDVATALLIGPSETPGLLSMSLVSDGSFQRAVIFSRGRDEATDTPWWTAGGPFFFGSQDPKKAHEIMATTVKMGATTLREACAKGGIDPSRLEVICAPHIRGWIPGAIAQSLGLPASVAPHTYEEIAHVGGCGAVANLIEARRRGMLRPGTLVGLYAQGQGMTRAAAILSWTGAPS